MTNSQRLAIVRACLQQWLQDNDENHSGSSPILRESILVRNDFFCGRQFHSEAHRAVWFIEEDQLKIYDQDRRVVAVFEGHQIDEAIEMEPRILKLPEPDQDGEIRRAA
ncbi:MAG: hypothetical protein AAGG48_24930 [Planctomycetota bacterium]